MLVNILRLVLFLIVSPYLVSASIVAGNINGIAMHASPSGGCADGSIDLDINGGFAPYDILWSTGSTESTVSNLSPAQYCVTVTDNSCGVAVECWNIKCCTPFDAEDVEININNPACGAGMGSVSLSLADELFPDLPFGLTVLNQASGDENEYSIESTLFEVTALGIGDYVFTIAHGEGCSYSFPVEIEILDMELSIVSTHSCDNDGTIDVSVENGNPPYTYEWSGVTSDQSSVGNLAGGTYGVTVTDSDLCTSSGWVEISSSGPLYVEGAFVMVNDVSACNMQDGSIEFFNQNNGGTPPYTYLWSNGEDTRFNINIGVGNYTVTVTDANGCIGSNSYIISGSGAPSILQSTIVETCIDADEVAYRGSITITASTTEGDALYLWSNGSTSSSDGTLTSTIDNLDVGEYCVTVTDSDNGCITSACYEVEAIWSDSPLISNIRLVNNECNNNQDGELLVQASGGLEPYTYVWSNGATTANNSNLSAGNYSVEVTDRCGDESQVSQSILANSTIAVTGISLDYGVFTLNAVGYNGIEPYSYIWSTGEQGNSIATSEPGTYSLTITDANGCSFEDEFVLELDCGELDMELRYLEALPLPHCNGTYPIRFEQESTGTGPFSVKIERFEDEQYNVLLFEIVETIDLLLDYERHILQGKLRITVLDNCGTEWQKIIKTCHNCENEITFGDNKVFYSFFDGAVELEQICPCDEDCGFLGLTRDKVKVKVYEDLYDSSLLTARIKFTWPDDRTTEIYRSVQQSSSGELIVRGVEEYILSTEEFNNGGIWVNLKFAYAIFTGPPQEVCETDIFIEFNKKSETGSLWRYSNLDSWPAIQPYLPVNMGTHKCTSECDVPWLDDRFIYEDVNFSDICENGLEWETQLFVFYPDDIANPCDGGGRLLTHFQTQSGSIVNGIKRVPPNVSVAHLIEYGSTVIWENQQSGWDYNCDALGDKGYCIFDGIDVYGHKTEHPILATYCDGLEYDPLQDSDDDGIPDNEDPCPLDPDLNCGIFDDDDGGIDPGDIGSGGGDGDCDTTFDPQECTLTIFCFGEEPEVIEGSIQTQSQHGNAPCVYCFTGQVCTVIDPNSGEEYSSVVGPIVNNLGFGPSNNGEDDCGNEDLCQVDFYCNYGEGVPFWSTCTPDCQLPVNLICDYSDLANIFDFTDPYNEDSFNARNYELIGSVDHSSLYDFILYPNPSGNNITAEFGSARASKIKIEIIDVSGRITDTFTFDGVTGKNTKNINTDLPNGLYIIKITNQTHAIFRKHIIIN